MLTCNKLRMNLIELQQLQIYAKELGINPAGKSKRELCAELAKSYEEYLSLKSKIDDNIGDKRYVHNFKCKGDTEHHDLTGEPWENIPPEDIFMDNNEFCFSYDDAENLIQYNMNHPLTAQPLASIKSKKGETIKQFYNKRKSKKGKENLGDIERLKKLEDIHSSIAIDYIRLYEFKLTEAIDKHPMLSERNYFDMSTLEPWRNKSPNLYKKFLTEVKYLQIAIAHKKALSELYNFNGTPTYAEFLTLLTNSISKVTEKDRQTYRLNLKILFEEGNAFIGPNP